MKSKHKIILLLVVVLAFSSISCSLTRIFDFGNEPPEEKATQTLDKPLKKTPDKDLPPGPDSNRIKTLPPRNPQGQNTPNPPQTNSGEAKIYMIALNDNGSSGKPIGCNDSVVAVTVTIPQNQPPLKSSLEKLLSIHTKDYGGSGLYNSLYLSNLQVDSIEMNNSDAKIYLTGSFQSGGTCDNPRIKAQLEETALKAPNVQTAHFFINGKKLDELLSGSGS